ncbi:MAG: hypothetical protein IKF75_01695 [Lachnospiraceae bacterium]|nr:hypothetical protein [Lachnospiraceae bacterium]
MDDVITLITEEVTGCDDNGNEILSRSARDVLCRVYGVTRSEFYQAAAVDLQPELTIRLSDFQDYAGEKLARFHGELYTIIRTYRDSGSFCGGGLGLNGIELILQRRIGDEEEEES